MIKTQKEAVKWLNSRGYKVSRAGFNRAFKAGRIPTSEDGTFDEAALLGYAGTDLEATARVENRVITDAAEEKLLADAKLKKAQADRAELRLMTERGQLIDKDEAEAALAERAAFFKSEIENFARRKGAEIIDLVGGNSDLLPKFLKWWNNATADWMNAWSVDGFTMTDDDAEEVAVVDQPVYDRGQRLGTRGQQNAGNADDPGEMHELD